jgi:hypothetical protein
MHCPSCGTCDTGRVGTHQYYCWNCLLEFSQEKGEVKFFYVESDGTLVDVSEKVEM